MQAVWEEGELNDDNYPTIQHAAASTRAEVSSDGSYTLYRGGMRVHVFETAAGWVSSMRYGRRWRKSRPSPTPEAAAMARWGEDAAAALRHL